MPGIIKPKSDTPITVEFLEEMARDLNEFFGYI